MRRHNRLLVAVCLASLTSTIVHARDACTLPLGPLAAKKSVALGIFNAIADGLETPAKRAKYDTKIRDAGGSWSVFEILKDGNSVSLFTSATGVGMETIHETLGGGGLEMSVNKCTAAASGVYFEK